jgi:hypothetical protein
VLITSQNQHWPHGQAIQVPVLGREVSAEFLVTRTSDPDGQAAAALATELDGLPLALEQAGAYIQATAGSLAGYLDLFRHRRADLLSRGEPTGHPLTVAATFTLALSSIEEASPAAAGLLRLLAFLAPKPVPLPELLPASGSLDGEIGELLGPLGDPVAQGDAVVLLRRYSLVTPAGDGMVLVHRLVQDVIRDQLPSDLGADQTWAWRQAGGRVPRLPGPVGDWAQACCVRRWRFAGR